MIIVELRGAQNLRTYFEIPCIQSFSVRLMDLKERDLNLSVQPITFLAPTGALVVAPLQLFHITSSRSSKSLYNLLALLKNL